MTQDLCRREFEKWFTDYFDYSPYSQFNKDVFSSTLSETRWISWKAGWNAKPATEHNSNVRNVQTVHNPADNSQNVEYL